MADEETLLLSGSAENQLNEVLRRNIRLSKWKDNKNRALRNAGKPYRNRKGTFVPGKCASENSMFLVQCCMVLEDVKRRNVAEDISWSQATFKYHLPVNGKSYYVCKKTMLNVFQISSRCVQTLQTKMKFNLDISDKRGTHHNRPGAVSFDVKELVREHISSMPAQENYYLRSASSKLYLSSELCVERMYDLFKERTYSEVNSSLDLVLHNQTLFHILRPKMSRRGFSAQSKLHRRKAEYAYKVLHEDVLMSKSNPTYVVLCTDVQQVLFCPTLHHSSMFYQTNVSTTWELKLTGTCGNMKIYGYVELVYTP
ncbi:hypothetical protein PR048_019589 [Dryococelus australis]|uniref:Uncharacterized protein n=1 Tax=Dryococelus australis TaxID=614101 RepID=A0ABQ9H3W6_9NEOP|nr:hypothetical protein PR048_019589 [Dryococelus australis]